MISSMFQSHPLDRDAMLDQFNVLMGEILETGLRRARFRPWEIGILLDIEGSKLRGAARRAALRNYQDAVQTEFEKGARLPQKFSEFLERQATQATVTSGTLVQN
jgi:hypothetical protein